MVSSSMRPSAAPPTNANLYCAQCDSQLGIFENEWVRLTASYMSSKEKGTHFGTEVGTRTQTVPNGSSHNAAEGCEMSEVFCKKCSAVVGQYCKSAPHQSKQNLVNQYFYKLSRIYLKNSTTFARVEPVFGFGGSEFAHVPTGSVRSSLAPGARLASVGRSSRTPLRQSFPPDPRHASLYPPLGQDANISPPELERSDERSEFPDTSGETSQSFAKDSSASTDYWRRLIHVDARSKNQGHRLRDHEEQLGDFEFRMMNYDTRFQRLESVSTASSARFDKTESMLALQSQKLSESNQQLKQMSSQLVSLQNAMQELKGLLNDQRGNHTSSILSTQEMSHIQDLRAENASMRAKLDTVTTVLGSFSESDILMSSETASQNALLPALQLLGKRKRHELRDQLSEDHGTARSTQTNALIRNAQQSAEQIPTPRSSLPSETSPTQATQTEDMRPNEEETPSLADERTPNETAVDVSEDYVGISEAAADEDIVSDVHMEDAQSSANQVINENALESENPQDSMLTANPPTIDFSDEEMVQTVSSVHRDRGHPDAPTNTARNTREPNRRVTDSALVIRDDRSMAPEPTKRPKLGGPRRQTMGINLDRNLITTPDMFVGVDMGSQPKNIRPKLAQTRDTELNEELTRLGMIQWIGKNKNSKAYRDALDAARTREREVKKAMQLHNLGLSQNIPPTILDAIQSINEAAAASKIAAQDLTKMYDEPYLHGVLRVKAPPKEKSKEMSRNVPKRTRKSNPIQQSDVVATQIDSTGAQEVVTVLDTPNLEAAEVQQVLVPGLEAESEVSHQEPLSASVEENIAAVAKDLGEQMTPKRRSRRSTKQLQDTHDESQAASTKNQDDCAVCGKRGKLLCCDGCPQVYHHKCLDPPLNPKDKINGEWYCPACLGTRETRPLQAVDANARMQREQAIMERDRMAREVMEREEMMEGQRY